MPRGRHDFRISSLVAQPQADRSPPGHVDSAQRISISAKNSKKSPGFAGLASLPANSHLDTYTALSCVQGLHEVLAVSVQACGLKDVENIMNVKFCEPIWEDSPCEIRMAMIIKCLSRQHLVDFDFHVQQLSTSLP